MMLLQVKELDQKFMKAGHNVQYQNVFLKFDNDPYGISSSGIIALCL